MEKPKPDLEKIRKITRLHDELPPVVIQPPRWYNRPSSLLGLLLILIVVVLLRCGVLP